MSATAGDEQTTHTNDGAHANVIVDLPRKVGVWGALALLLGVVIGSGVV